MTTVLVVDDVAADRALAAGLIEKGTGFTVTTASSAEEAWERISRLAPDLIVTDLQMEGLNGLDLVEMVDQAFPDVPVILMTAHGSEEIATAALQAGAVTYVPKIQLTAQLANTVQQVVELFRDERRHERLLKHLTVLNASFVLDNDPQLISPLIRHLQQQLSNMGLCVPHETLRVGIALEEALTNAMYHGNLEISREEFEEGRSAMIVGEPFNVVRQRRQQLPYSQRQIRVRVALNPNEAQFTIADDGRGFDPSQVPDPPQGESWEGRPGRGLKTMRMLMDEVVYNQQGNAVTLIKRRRPGAADIDDSEISLSD